MKFKLLLLLHGVLLIGCGETESLARKYPPDNHELVTIQQGVWGNVWFWEGDFMPFGWGRITPVSEMIYIHELTLCNALEPPVGTFFTQINTAPLDSIESGENGFFEIALPPGEYSVFVRLDTLYYANWFSDCSSVPCVTPVVVTSDSVSHFQIDITFNATF